MRIEFGFRGQRRTSAVGDKNFMVVAIDNEKDRAVYVGPVYSYYEFTVPAASPLTDTTWGMRIESNSIPPRPKFTDVFRAPAHTRQLGPVDKSKASQLRH